mmetsp:Transcript_49991/g.106326  ORF Transcript_49991/g.106326 Transcript_49991/m.106326 type:complete len:115 (-) Transcript_49991:74-418(-)
MNAIDRLQATQVRFIIKGGLSLNCIHTLQGQKEPPSCFPWYNWFAFVCLDGFAGKESNNETIGFTICNHFVSCFNYVNMPDMDDVSTHANVYQSICHVEIVVVGLLQLAPPQPQ